jgi:hypothetical protein
VIGNGRMFITEVSFDAPYSYTLWRLDAIGGEYLCDTTAPSNHIIAGSPAHDFELSPDGARIAFFRSTSTASGAVETDASDILIGPSSGDGPFITLLTVNGAANIGTHWVSGGRQLIWTSTSFKIAGSSDAGNTSYNRPTSSSVWIANADGTHMRELQRVTSTSSDARMFHTGSSGCSMGSRGRSDRNLSWTVCMVLATLLGCQRKKSAPPVSNASARRRVRIAA